MATVIFMPELNDQIVHKPEDRRTALIASIKQNAKRIRNKSLIASRCGISLASLNNHLNPYYNSSTTPETLALIANVVRQIIEEMEQGKAANIEAAEKTIQSIKS